MALGGISSAIASAKTFLATEQGKALATKAGESVLSRFFARKADKDEASFAALTPPSREEFEAAFENLQERLFSSQEAMAMRIEARIGRLQLIVVGQSLVLLAVIVGLYF